MHRLVVSMFSVLSMALFVAGCGGSPEAAYAAMVESAEAGEWEQVYDAMSLKTQARMDVGLEMLVGLATAFAGDETEAAAELESLSGKALFARMMENPDMAPNVVELGDYEVIEKRIDGDRAELDVRRGQKIETVVLVKEDGGWKMDSDFGEGDAAGSDDEAASKDSKDEPATDMVALRARATHEAQMAAFDEALGVAVLEKQFLDSDYEAGRYSEELVVEFAFENRSDKPILGFKGTVEFSDMFGDRIYATNLSYDEGVAAGSTATWTGTLDYNQFMDNHVKLANTPLEKMQVEWVPETILFEDGSELVIDASN